MSPHPRRPRVPGPRVLRALAAAGVALALLVWWLLPAGAAPPSGRVTMATGLSTGVYARYGELLKQRMTRGGSELELRLLSSQGSRENIAMLVRGEADFTIAQADTVADYIAEGGPGAGSLRACARLYDDYMQLVVPASSPVRSVRDLKGRRVGMGGDGSGVRKVAERLLEAAGLDPDEDVEAVPDGIDDLPHMLENDRLEAFFWSGGLPTSAVTDLSARTPIRLVPLGGLVPGLHPPGESGSRRYRAAVMPQDAYPRVQGGDGVTTVAVPNLLLTRADTDAALTEAVTRAVIRNRDAIGSEVHAAQRVDLRTAIYTEPLELHTGARRYYRAAKP